MAYSGFVHIPMRKRSQNGFTLIEMAVVVVIIGILMAAGLKVAGVQRDAAAYSATRTKQEAIKQALINYLRNNRRLPCPDSRVGWGNDGAAFAIGSAPDGIENRADAGANPINPAVGCDARVGVLPWATLGLARDAALDGFGNFFTYFVSAPVATANDWNITANFRSGLLGGITRQERFDNAPALNPVAPDAVVAVVSHGKNGLGAFTTKGSQNVMPLVANALFVDEGENANGDAVYIQRDTNNDPAANGGVYDDVVMMLTPDDLISPLAKEGTMKSAMAQAMEDLETLKFQVIELKRVAVNAGTCVSTIAVPALNDPWGVAYTMAPNDGSVFPITISSSIPPGMAAALTVTVEASYYNNSTTGTDCP